MDVMKNEKVACCVDFVTDTILPSFVLISAMLATLRRGLSVPPPLLVLQGSKKTSINRVKKVY